MTHYQSSPQHLSQAVEPDDNFSPDINPTETQEWQDSFLAVIKHVGVERAAFLLKTLYTTAISSELPIARLNTDYVNTIPLDAEPMMSGDLHMERRVRALIRWNALVMVLRANVHDDLGGHIATFASSATLYDVGFNHFFKAGNGAQDNDLMYYQGHSAPGIYARSFLEGRLSESQLANFRREIGGKGLSSYPHPYLMPDYWQFPTVSMGLGPIMSIYQAHIQKYLNNRKLLDNPNRKIWAFLGDGEMDEPESLGAISLAGREKLDNLIWVVNCNLQRLDGPVRGNGKIIQELEAAFRGAGWRVIKVIWGRKWDPLLAQDTTGLLRKRMDEVTDGEYQAYKAKGGAYTRQYFFGKYPELLELVKDLSDDDILNLNRGGHDPSKVYAAYSEATSTVGQPTVILAKTVKGYGLSNRVESVNKTHQIKKLDTASLQYFRDRFNLPFDDDVLATMPFYRPEETSPEIQYLKARRKALGGVLPLRHHQHIPLNIPDISAFSQVLAGSGDKEQSTTMVFVRLLTTLINNPDLAARVVPIVPDEARTFGLEGMFKKLGIYSAAGQVYVPEDNEQLMGYREAIDGHMLEEGINEAGATSAWIALATSYSSNALPMIPIYLFYSMFGFQRVGDLLWAAADAQAQGFLIGATAGRTTLNGEGLQHQDGHSPILASTIANCVSYDPCFGYELAVIVHDGLRRMYGNGERVFYYLTCMNENYVHPPMPTSQFSTVAEGICKGIYLYQKTAKASVQLLGSGSILLEVIRAAKLLQDEYGIAANIWSVTSFTELNRDAMACEHYNRLHPQEIPKQPWLQQQLNPVLHEITATQSNAQQSTVVVAATDYMRTYAEQIRAWLPTGLPYITLGTDGFGRSDTRENLRQFFGINAESIVVATLKALADEGDIDARLVKDAILSFGLDSSTAPAWVATCNDAPHPAPLTTDNTNMIVIPVQTNTVQTSNTNEVNHGN